MATYCIGDLQGCFDELQRLLDLINYDSNKDQLWFVGDLINRGPKSLEVLRFLHQQPNIKIVLGNHDLHLLMVYHKIVDFEASTLQEILKAPDCAKLISWLRHQPILYYDQDYQIALVHAGIYPAWDLVEALEHADEVHTILRSPNYLEFLTNLYYHQPDSWDPSLTAWERLRFIANAFTRMRFCDRHGKLDFISSGPLPAAPEGFLPWFAVPGRQTQNLKIAFGHWATLQGQVDVPNLFALDTACVYGQYLTALRLEDGKRFQVSATPKII